MTATLTRDGLAHAPAAGPAGPTTRCGRDDTTYPAGPAQPVDCPACLALPSATLADARIIGAGDGSVMIYCSLCRDPLPHRAHRGTLDTAVTAWAEHAAAAHGPRG